jgi:nitrogenase molybdenum-cofactor synthesis protein NifE
MMNAEMDVLVLEKLAFDLCFGYLPDTNRNIPYVPDMLDFYGQVGYDRTSNLLRRILDVLEEMGASGKGGG